MSEGLLRFFQHSWYSQAHAFYAIKNPGDWCLSFIRSSSHIKVVKVLNTIESDLHDDN